METVLVTACFNAGSLKSNVVASFLNKDRLFFLPATIRSNQFSRRKVRFREDYHKEVVRSLKSAEMLRVESNAGHEGPYFELMTIGSWNFQEMVWRIPFEDLDFWSIYSLVSEIPGFNSLLAADPEYVQWESEVSVGAYEQAGKSHAHLRKIDDQDFGGKKIDISQNYGRRTLFPGFWIQAPWQGCFSGLALRVIGKTRLTTIASVSDIRQLDDGAVYVRLFEDPHSAALPENRERQRLFREWLSLDVLEESAVSKAADQADPVIEIEEGEFASGGVRLFRRWLDDDGRPVRRSMAVGFEEAELDRSGRVISNRCQEKRS